jgi:hypothetical protein
MDSKKIFDVSPPKPSEPLVETKNIRKIMLNEPVLSQETTATTEIETMPEIKVKEVPHQELMLTPLTENPTVAPLNEPIVNGERDEAQKDSESNEATLESPEYEPLSDASVEETSPSAEPEKEAEEEKQEPIKELASFDSVVPDDSQRASASAKGAMQSPAMYDTKAYYVPIGNSIHKHGHLTSTIIAGLVTALFLIAAVIAVGTFL